MNGLSYIMFVTDKSQKEVSHELGVTKQMVSNWIRGEKKISEKHLPRLAELFKVEPKYFEKELSLVDKIEIELQLTTKTKEFNDMIHQAVQLQKQNKAIQEKYESVLDMVNEYARGFHLMKEDVEGLHKSYLSLITIPAISDSPEACMEVSSILQTIQKLRTQIRTFEE